MKRIAFADESGLDGLSSCYGIGVVSFDRELLDNFNGYFSSKLADHGVVGEAKWKKVTTSHGLINFALDALRSILRSHTASFDIIVVNTTQYRNWNSNLMTREDAFYRTFTLLLRHIAERSCLPAEIYIDNRSDSYAKRHEAMQTIGNYMLAQLASSGRLDRVEKVESRESVGVQVADLLTGAITAAHSRKLNSKFPLHKGKQLAIERLADMIGWDDLCYDTMPSDKINIWHFPKEYRAFPATLSLTWMREPRYVSAIDLMRRRQITPVVDSVARKSA